MRLLQHSGKPTGPTVWSLLLLMNSKVTAFAVRHDGTAPLGVAPRRVAVSSYSPFLLRLTKRDSAGNKLTTKAFTSDLAGRAPKLARVRQACHR